MSLMQRVWTGLVIVVVVFLAARVTITLLSPHPVYVCLLYTSPSPRD